jgi:hypothetical protein
MQINTEQWILLEIMLEIPLEINVSFVAHNVYVVGYKGNIDPQ